MDRICSNLARRGRLADRQFFLGIMVNEPMNRNGSTLKILFVHDHLGAFGGAEANILLTATELKSRGYQLGLFYYRKTGKGEESWHQVFDSVYRSDDWEPSAALEVFKPDIVYLHSLSDLKALADFTSAAVPTVRMVHDHAMYCLRTYKYNFFTRKVCQQPASFRCIFPCLASVLRNQGTGFPLRFASLASKKREIALNQRCDRFVVYSDYCKQELIRNGFNADLIHIHVPIRCWGEEAPRSTFTEDNIILFAGQIIRGKGVDALLRALAKVRSPFHAIILGDGNHRAYCERLANDLGLQQRVSFEGYIPPEKMRSFYLRASLFAVSSLWPEPFGMVGPEAMRYGLPVVAFDAGGISEWLINGENGYLVRWGNTDEYAARIDQLLMDKNFGRELGNNGRERVNLVYDSARQVNVLEQVFKSVSAEKRAASSATPATVGL